MKQSALRQIVRLLAVMVLATPLVPAARAIQGDWRLQIDIDGQQIPSILSLSKQADGTLKGEWLCFWGITPLREIKYESRRLSFAMTIRLDEGDTDTKFVGAVKQGELSGIFSNNTGEYQAKGKRIKRMSMVAGTWETKLKVGEREFTADLVIKADAQGKLSAEWKSQYGEHEVTNVQFKAPKLSFDRKSSVRDRQWESNFEGTVKGHTLSGTIKSDRGEIALEGKRAGALLIGQWELDVKFDGGTRRELLRVFPDLSKASVITLYLLPELNVRLIPQLEKLKPGSRIVSHDFDMKGVKPDKVVELTIEDAWDQHTIYLWTTPLKKEKAIDNRG